MNPMTKPGMYARRIGMTQAITGPIAASRSDRHGADTVIAEPTYTTVSDAATTKRTVGRIPNVGVIAAGEPAQLAGDPARMPVTNESSGAGGGASSPVQGEIAGHR